MQQFIIIIRFTILISTSVFLWSCAKEYEVIEEKIDFPETVELIPVNLSGVVTDRSGQAIRGAIIEISVDGYQLESQSTDAEGRYSFSPAKVHPDRTWIKVLHNNHPPNFGYLPFPYNENVQIDFTLAAKAFSKYYDPSLTIHHGIPGVLEIQIPVEAVDIQEEILVSSQIFQLNGNQNLFQVRNAQHSDGEDLLLHLNSVIYLDAVDQQGKTLKINNDKRIYVEFSSTLSVNPGKINIWKLDQESRKWKSGIEAIREGNIYFFLADEFTYYAFVNECGGVTGDKILPVSMCREVITLNLAEKTRLFPKDIDNGSFDLCDPELAFRVRKTSNLCNPEDTLYKDFVSFCQQEINSTQEVYMKAIDDDGNFNECAVMVQVEFK